MSKSALGRDRVAESYCHFWWQKWRKSHARHLWRERGTQSLKQTLRGQSVCRLCFLTPLRPALATTAQVGRFSADDAMCDLLVRLRRRTDIPDDRQPTTVNRLTDPSGAHRTTSPNVGEEFWDGGLRPTYTG